ncbi:hypothetical protein H9L21_00825 [Aeromicrobium senzhongii]|uniref:Uncharacterized protein n=1 Tax=Aeromicrobium senzhongii TaxID=2663859 RepID=A0ABX6SU48_9ACTN|nr:hypothetical protein [Aeromicrobium senzhongii]MTB88482.1 hypothetical protein [Aeromicrobium senzhongii]QNL94556.1 hypothetical protein H9L21_00825 [Aeromicrobium senzhongii]
MTQDAQGSPGPGFTLADLLSVLGGVPEYSEDGSRLVIAKSSWGGGRAFDVEIEGAVAYLNDEFFPTSAHPGRKAIADGLSYFDLEIQEFTGTTPPAGDPIIIDRDGPRLTHDVSWGDILPELADPGGQWFARADDVEEEDRPAP